MPHQAEKLKIKFGAALADEVYDNRIITIPGLKGREPKEISEKNLALIIQARMEEIFDYVLWEIRRSGYDKKLIGGIVMTGGGSLLKHIDILAEYHTGIPTRVGYPVDLLAHGYPEEIATPICATSIGLLKHAFDHRDYESALNMPEIKEEEKVPDLQEIEREDLENPMLDDDRRGWWDRAFHKTKQWFEAEPDPDLN